MKGMKGIQWLQAYHVQYKYMLPIRPEYLTKQDQKRKPSLPLLLCLPSDNVRDELQRWSLKNIRARTTAPGGCDINRRTHDTVGFLYHESTMKLLTSAIRWANVSTYSSPFTKYFFLWALCCLLGLGFCYDSLMIRYASYWYDIISYVSW